ncbi:hypothetical protein BH10PSE19_BH10PSE19_11440 [soil metagenome]
MMLNPLKKSKKLNRRTKLFFLVMLTSFSPNVLAAIKPHTEGTIATTPQATADSLPLKQSALQKIPYDEKLFNTSYKVFLANGSLEDAFQMAQIAVQHNPNSVVWHERLALVALWNNKPYLAIEQWIYLISRHNKIDFLDTAIEMSNKIKSYTQLVTLLKIKLSKSPHQKNTILQLANAYDNLASPKAAIQLLRNEMSTHPQEAYLRKIAEIYSGLGNWDAQLAILREIQQHYTLTTKDVMLQANILAVNNQNIPAAIKILKSVSNKNNLSSNYWNMFSDFGLKFADEKMAYLGYQKVSKSTKLSTEQALDYSFLTLKFNPNYDYALTVFMQQWRGHRQSDDLTVASITEAIRIRSWRALRELFSHILPQQGSHLANERDYWVGKALLLEHDYNLKVAREFLMTHIQQAPAATPLKSAYLEILLNQARHFLPQYDSASLPQALATWQNLFSNNELADLAIQAYLLLNEPYSALNIYQKQLSAHESDYFWLNNFNTVLINTHLEKDAFNIQAKNWNFAVEQLLKNPERVAIYKQFWQFFGHNAQAFTSANIYYPLLANLASYTYDESLISELLEWAVYNDRQDLAEYLLNYYYPNGAPAWALLNIGIINNDKDMLHALLAERANVLPTVDRVTAAEQIDDIPLAQQLAVDNVSKDPSNSYLYEQMTPLLLKTANEFSMDQYYETYGLIGGPHSKLKAKLFIDAQWSVSPYVGTWFTHSKDRFKMANPPSLDEELGVMLKKETKNEMYALTVGQRNSLTNFFTGIFDYHKELLTQLSTDIKLSVNERSNVSDFMYIAGVQNEAKVGLTYRLTHRDTFSGSLFADRYATQDHQYLGNSISAEAAYYHKLWFSYPDFTVAALGSMNELTHSNKILGGRIPHMLGTGEAPTVDLFLPKSFWVAGVSFIFGDEVKNNYTHAWRPYASITLLYNSGAGVGHDIEAGIAGSLFGRDKLSFYLLDSENLNGTAQQNYIAGAQYKIFF